MDSLSALDPLAWEPEYLREHPAYTAGNALGWLYHSGNKQAATSYPLSGRLYLAKSGWLLLSVPNALVRGVFDALTAPGAELPTAGVMNVPNVDAQLVNAHISVLTAAEVAAIGADKINESGRFKSRPRGFRRCAKATGCRRSPMTTSRFTLLWLCAVRAFCSITASPRVTKPLPKRRKGIGLVTLLAAAN